MIARDSPATAGGVLPAAPAYARPERVLDLTSVIASSPAVDRLAAALDRGGHVVAAGSAGSSTAFVAAAIARRVGRPVLLVVAHLDDADEALDELSAAGVEALRLPALEALPGESNVNPELFAERLAVVRRVIELNGVRPSPAVDSSSPSQRLTVSPSHSPVIIAPIPALMQAVPRAESLPALVRTLRRGMTAAPGEVIRWLDGAGYTRRDAVEEPGDFAVRGGILDVFAAGGTMTPAGDAPGEALTAPIRLDFFGDRIDRVHEIDPDTMASGRTVEGVELVCVSAQAAAVGDAGVSVLELLPARAVAVVAETMEVTEQGRGYYERVTDSRGVFGPPAVFKLIADRLHGLAEVNQFSAGSSSADARLGLPASPLPVFSQDAAEAVKELGGLAAEHDVRVFCQNPGELQRFGELMAEFAPQAAGGIEACVQYLHRGFIWRSDAEAVSSKPRVCPPATPETKAAAPEPSSKTPQARRPGWADVSSLFLPYHELVHRYQTRRRASRLRAGRAMDTFLDFAPGDYVVHAEHGIARFLGLKMMKPKGDDGASPRAISEGGAIPDSLLPKGHKPRAEEVQEYLTLEFAGAAKLNVPAANIDQVQKYIGGFRGKPPLSTLGGTRWKSQKDRVAESVKDLAAEMLRVRAARESMPGIRYAGDTAWQKEFEAEFPYEETEDQLAALVEIKKDMQAQRPMDRLVCGDVGFGKTELAIRAAFKAVEFGKQAAVLVPTTVLAEQHERTFRTRFAGYPFRVESLSRFKSDAEQRQILEAVRKGQVDVLIGTHRILSEDVRFADLGVVCIDEEQRFGVEHKERLLRLRMTVDVLTLSATPIPRTLHMAMLGLRDISSLTTPPLDRRAIVTEVIPYNERRIAQALARELSREGQVFFVHNRVHNIRSVADQVQKLAPDARIVVGHGQMSPHELEDVMLKFMRREADVLVSTTIIESGIDIASANTMFINDADRFGLADLHQLRGRVGRSKHRAYCYMLLPADRPVKEVAQRRLKAIEQYSMLGAGFKIAMRDLEIRGAGNLLGAEQSGHIAAIGYDMYCKVLDQAVRELRREDPPATASRTAIEIGIIGTIPKPYIPSDQRRLEAYRRVAVAATAEELARVAKELTDAYGEPPVQVRRLLDLAELRVAAAGLGVKIITIRGQDVLFRVERTEALAAKLNEKREREAPPQSVRSSVPARSFERRLAAATAPRPGAASPGLAAPDVSAVRVLPPPSGETLHEVYLRVPRNYLEPDTLLAVLRKRLT
ncbi:MAG: transcription-repair coupling factor [Phycisphaerales bacterium]